MMSSRLTNSGASERERKKSLGIVRMADADVAVGVHHLLVAQDAVGDDEIFENDVEIAHGWMTRG